MSGRRRLSWLVLAFALLLAVAAGGSAAYARWKRVHQPLVEWTVPGLGSDGFEIAFAREGSALLVHRHSAPASLDVWSADSGELLRTIPDPPGRVNDVQYAPAGDVVAYFKTTPGGANVFAVVALETGDALASFDGIDDLSWPALSRRGDVVAIVRTTDQLDLCETRGGRLLRTLALPHKASNERTYKPLIDLEADRLSLGVGDTTCEYSLRTGEIATTASDCVALAIGHGELAVQAHRPTTLWETRRTASGPAIRALPSLDGAQDESFFPEARLYLGSFGTADVGTHTLVVRSLDDDSLKRSFTRMCAAQATVTFAGDRVAVLDATGRLEIWEVPP